MKRYFSFTLFLVLFSIPALSQHHYNNWVRRNATDTTIVHCWNDSLSRVSYPPNCIGMGMMVPDSIYCRINRMPMDSLHHPFDSTFLGWHRMEIGSDSSHFNFMHCGSGNGSNYMMQFSRGLRCELYWDSLMTDSLHRHWKPKGMMGWNGSQWISLSGVNFNGNIATVTTSQAYAAIAFVGQPEKITEANTSQPIPNSFILEQNYPNPFNPSTVIPFSLPIAEDVSLKVYNILGREIVTLINSKTLSVGQHFVKLDASTLSSGIYFYTLQVGTERVSKKMLLMR